MSDSGILWTKEAPLVGFPRSEYWGGLPFPLAGGLPEPGLGPASLVSCIGRQVPYQSRHMGSLSFL